MTTETVAPEVVEQPATFEAALAAGMASHDNQANMSMIKVTMLPEYVEVELMEGVKKLVSYNDFKTIINRHLGSVESAPVISGLLLPSNTLFISQTATDMYLTTYHPAGIKPLLYNEYKYQFPSPNIIISHHLKKQAEDWIVQQSLYYCTDLPAGKLPRSYINEVNRNNGVYDLPMSNTYGGGAMCYGSNSMPARFKEGNLRGLDWYYKYLWETPFNSDLGVRSMRISDVHGYYKAMDKLAQEGKGFPYGRLRDYRRHEGTPSGLDIGEEAQVEVD